MEVMCYLERGPSMTMWVFLLGLIGTARQTSAAKSSSKTPDSPRIVGGDEIQLTNAPFIVSLQIKKQHSCGGAILTLSHVLSACHCLGEADIGMSHADIAPRPIAHITVVAGTENIESPAEDRQVRAVSDIKLHPNCAYETILVYDFALAFLKEPLEENNKVRPFIMVSQEKDEFELSTRNLVGNKRKCYVAGWGSTVIEPKDGFHVAHSTLKAARMVVIPDADCREKLGQKNEKYLDFDFVGKGGICTLPYWHRNNESDCKGDSGGPFFCGSQVYGLVSYGYKCGQWDVPNVYAKLSSTVDWLKELRLIELVRITDMDFPQRRLRKISAAQFKGLQKFEIFILIPTLSLLIHSSLS